MSCKKSKSDSDIHKKLEPAHVIIIGQIGRLVVVGQNIDHSIQLVLRRIFLNQRTNMRTKTAYVSQISIFLVQECDSQRMRSIGRNVASVILARWEINLNFCSRRDEYSPKRASSTGISISNASYAGRVRISTFK